MRMKKRKKGFRTVLNPKEKKEALQNLGKPKTQHQVTLCFGGLKFMKAELEIDRAMFRDEISDLEEYAYERFKSTFPGLTRVIVHN